MALNSPYYPNVYNLFTVNGKIDYLVAGHIVYKPADFLDRPMAKTASSRYLTITDLTNNPAATQLFAKYSQRLVEANITNLSLMQGPENELMVFLHGDNGNVPTTNELLGKQLKLFHEIRGRLPLEANVAGRVLCNLQFSTPESPFRYGMGRDRVWMFGQMIRG